MPSTKACFEVSLCSPLGYKKVHFLLSRKVAYQNSLLFHFLFPDHPQANTLLSPQGVHYYTHINKQSPVAQKQWQRCVSFVSLTIKLNNLPITGFPVVFIISFTVCILSRINIGLYPSSTISPKYSSKYTNISSTLSTSALRTHKKFFPRT